MSASPTMNIGIFLPVLNPAHASEARFQNTIFDALRRTATSRYNFVVFTYDKPEGRRQSDGFTYVTLPQPSRGFSQVAQFWKLRFGGVLLALLNLVGAGGSGTYAKLLRWLHPEPGYYQLVRDHNIRLMWNLGQHVLVTKVPFLRVVWDVNNRIHPMYPEFSYTRYGFDGGEAELAYSLPRASYVIVGTEEGKKQLVDLYGVYAPKIRVLPFPTPVLSRAGVTPRQPGGYLFYPARFWPHKNHVVLISALRILRDEYGMKLECLFSGANEGNHDYLMRYAREQGVSDQVRYIGLVPDAELAAVYRGALALTYVSAVGPDNLPPLEAMALECPVITADVPGAREQYGDAALFFRPTDERDLAERIHQLAGNPGLRAAQIELGRKRAASWTADDYVGGVMSIIDEFQSIARAWDRCDSEFT